MQKKMNDLIATVTVGFIFIGQLENSLNTIM
jgi:hypothetical protein